MKNQFPDKWLIADGQAESLGQDSKDCFTPELLKCWTRRDIACLSTSNSLPEKSPC
jgi:hypothetical protein